MSALRPIASCAGNALRFAIFQGVVLCLALHLPGAAALRAGVASSQDDVMSSPCLVVTAVARDTVVNPNDPTCRTRRAPGLR